MITTMAIEIMEQENNIKREKAFLAESRKVSFKGIGFKYLAAFLKCRKFARNNIGCSTKVGALWMATKVAIRGFFMKSTSINDLLLIKQPSLFDKWLFNYLSWGQWESGKFATSSIIENAMLTYSHGFYYVENGISTLSLDNEIDCLYELEGIA